MGRRGTGLERPERMARWMSYPVVRLINLTISVCTPCLADAGGECHTPGCAFWMQDAPTAELNAILLQNCRPAADE